MSITSPRQPEDVEAAGGAAAEPVRVMIVDDHELFRVGLARLLQSDPRLEVVGGAGDADAAIRLAGALDPDVILMDIQLPGRDGIDAIAGLVSSGSRAKILVLTTFETDSYVLQALEAGASGYLLKDCTPSAIVASILAVAGGEHVMARQVTDRLKVLLSSGSSARAAYDGLSARELEVLKLMAQGMANKQIAYALRISEKTVRNHISNLYDKLGVRDRSQALLYAVRKGLVRP